MFFEKLESYFKVPFIYLFLNAFFFSFVGIYFASLIFGSNVGLVSVFIVSIALMPVINKALSITMVEAGRERESRENVYLTQLSIKEQKLSLRRLLDDYKDIFQTYAAIFLGVFFAFALLSIFLPTETANVFLGDQLKVLRGNAFNFGFFETIVWNNLLILLISFAFSAIFKLGTTFIIIWNASAWGAVFAAYAKQIAAATASEPLMQLFLLLAIVLPHTIIEAMAYFSASISGGITHKAIAEEKLASERFNTILIHAAFLLALAVFFVLLGGTIETIVRGILR